MSYLRDDASTFLPQATLDEGEKSEIIDKVTSKYAALGPMSKQQTKLEYLDLCNSLKTFGATFFPVENRRNRQMPIDMVLAVNRQVKRTIINKKRAKSKNNDIGYSSSRSEKQCKKY